MGTYYKSSIIYGFPSCDYDDILSANFGDPIYGDIVCSSEEEEQKIYDKANEIYEDFRDNSHYSIYTDGYGDIDFDVFGIEVASAQWARDITELNSALFTTFIIENGESIAKMCKEYYKYFPQYINQKPKFYLVTRRT